MNDTKKSFSVQDERRFRRIASNPGQIYGTVESETDSAFTVKLTAPYATATDWKKAGTLVTLSKRLWKLIP